MTQDEARVKVIEWMRQAPPGTIEFFRSTLSAGGEFSGDCREIVKLLALIGFGAVEQQLLSPVVRERTGLEGW